MCRWYKAKTGLSDRLEKPRRNSKWPWTGKKPSWVNALILLPNICCVITTLVSVLPTVPLRAQGPQYLTQGLAYEGYSVCWVEPKSCRGIWKKVKGMKPEKGYFRQSRDWPMISISKARREVDSHNVRQAKRLWRTSCDFARQLNRPLKLDISCWGVWRRL